MNNHIIRKIAVVLIMVLPLVSYQGCKKQPKCGCGKDILFSLEDDLIEYSAIIYNEDGTNAYFRDGMDTYYFCNPSEMFQKFKTFAQGDQILMSGDVFWECNYIYSVSNYSYGYGYGSYYKVYNIQVTDMKAYLYGK
jgi:hypothetical protein